MEVPPFTQTQLDVIEIKHSNIKILNYLHHWEKTKQEQEEEDPKNIDEISLITGYTKKTLYGYCQKNQIPHYKKNGRLFFFKSEIIEWIKEGKQKTLKEIHSDTDDFLTNKNKRLK
ncbi:helix-turn-helix domain-containing protein [Formosa algae]|nr:helix-turn-helix domain-containing protein [Formosa algae]MBP1839409.1 putative DNA-binding transcriptional regulator AlpA [Formosa algae]